MASFGTAEPMRLCARVRWFNALWLSFLSAFFCCFAMVTIMMAHCAFLCGQNLGPGHGQSKTRYVVHWWNTKSLGLLGLIICRHKIGSKNRLCSRRTTTKCFQCYSSSSFCWMSRCWWRQCGQSLGARSQNLLSVARFRKKRWIKMPELFSWKPIILA